MAGREQRVVELVIDARPAVAGANQAGDAVDRYGARLEAAQAKFKATVERQQMIFSTEMPLSIERTQYAFNKLRASVDPAFAVGLKAQQEMARAMRQLDQAVLTGVATQQQADNVLTQLREKHIRDIDRVRDAQLRADQATMRSRQAQAHVNDNLRIDRGPNRADAANIGYQFQDVAVTAAMGMNPLMIGLQQGMQLAPVISSMERPVAGLAAAFMSLVNPVALVTVGLTAGAAALIQYFSTSRSGTAEMESDFAKQSQLIETVAAKWGAAYPALKSYADELQRARQESELVAASDAVSTMRMKDQLSTLDALAASERELSRIRRDITSDAGVQASQQYLQSMVDLRSALEQGRDPANALMGVMSSIAVIQRESATSQMDSYATSIKNLADQIWRARDASAAQRAEIERGLYGGTSVQDVLERNYFWDNGRAYKTSDFMPANPPIPMARPEQEVGPPTIMNSDGRMVLVPSPRDKPNYFERDDPLASYRSSYRSSYHDPAVAREELQRQALGAEFKGFLTNFSQTLQSNGGDIGDAFGKAVLNSATRAMDQSLDHLFNQIATSLVNAFMGPPSAGLLNKQIGFTGANTTLGEILGAGGGLSANDNVAGVFPGPANASSAPATDVASYIAQAASQRGIDPNVALSVARSEGGLSSWNMQSGIFKSGVQEPSYGPFQLYMGGGLGNEFQRRTGLDPRLAANGPAGVDFALDHAAKNGWGAWYGARNTGIGNWQGIGANAGSNGAIDTVNKFADSAGAATKSLDTFGGEVGKIGQSLSTSFFPPALAAPAQGGGGLFGWLGGLFGGTTLNSALSASPQFARAWSLGGIGLYDRGGFTGHGGVNDPAGVVHRGEVVWSQADVARAGGVPVVEAMRLGYRGYASGGAGGDRGYVAPARPVPTREAAPASFRFEHTHSFDKNGNLKTVTRTVVQEEAPDIARQVGAEQRRDDRIAQARGDFGRVQQQFMKRKG
ncbi:phage tail length tape measure family protein [Rhizobium puerariae]|uniref:Phage tail length tape measure family protein n=1 Tax=Rhizobium puerariae TaxID=1585791 RepID=A0ABV6ABY7_9HYPH